MPNLVWSFAPSFVSVVAERFSSLESAIGAGALTAVLVCARAAIGARLRPFDLAGVVSFVGLGSAVVLDPSAQHGRG